MNDNGVTEEAKFVYEGASTQQSYHLYVLKNSPATNLSFVKLVLYSQL